MATSISLDELVALNDEIAGLVRARVPLELGLTSWGRDLSGPLRKTVQTLSESVARGKSLNEALADESLDIPPVYRAVVVAGLRSGRLPSALEAIAESARSVKQLRAAVGLAMIYPLLLCCIGYCLLMLLVMYVLPALLAVYEKNPPPLLAAAGQFAAWLASGVPIPFSDRVLPLVFLPPVVLLLLAAFWWRQTRRAIVVDSGRAGRWLCWIPVAGRAVKNARTASLADLFGLLIDHDVPLGEALRLAATCTGDRRLMASGLELAAAVEAGHLPTRSRFEAAGVPPVLALLIATGARQQTLVAMSRQTAEMYRTRVVRDAQWLREWLPTWLVLIVGSVIGLAYCMAFFVPFTNLLQALSGAAGTTLRP